MKNYSANTLVVLGKAAATVVVFTGALMASACGNSDEEKALVQETKKPLGVGSAKKANAELEEAVRAKLESDPQLRGSQVNVAADVTRNQVTLSGTVSSEALRAKAMELAKSAQAGVMVSNKLNVKPKASNSTPPSRRRWYA